MQTLRKYKINEAILLLKELISLPAGWVKANLLALATASYPRYWSSAATISTALSCYASTATPSSSAPLPL
jgi:hypothetical protein